jgi:hypothetical protein
VVAAICDLVCADFYKGAAPAMPEDFLAVKAPAARASHGFLHTLQGELMR